MSVQTNPDILEGFCVRLYISVCGVQLSSTCTEYKKMGRCGQTAHSPVHSEPWDNLGYTLTACLTDSPALLLPLCLSGMAVK